MTKTQAHRADESPAGPCDAAGGAEQRLRCALSEALSAVRRYVFVLCGGWHEAEDIAAEALLRAWRGREKFDGRADARTWIFTIARNHWLDCLRRKRRGPRVQPMIEPPDIAAPCPSPPAAAAAAELGDAVRLALAALPPEQAEAVALRESRGLTFAQTAALLGIPVATAKSRVRYGLLKLAGELRAFGPEANP